jgi:hypothetical protein
MRGAAPAALLRFARPAGVSLRPAAGAPCVRTPALTRAACKATCQPRLGRPLGPIATVVKLQWRVGGSAGRAITFSRRAGCAKCSAARRYQAVVGGPASHAGRRACTPLVVRRGGLIVAARRHRRRRPHAPRLVAALLLLLLLGGRGKGGTACQAWARALLVSAHAQSRSYERPRLPPTCAFAASPCARRSASVASPAPLRDDGPVLQPALPAAALAAAIIAAATAGRASSRVVAGPPALPSPSRPPLLPGSGLELALRHDPATPLPPPPGPAAPHDGAGDAAPGGVAPGASGGVRQPVLRPACGAPPSVPPGDGSGE